MKKNQIPSDFDGTLSDFYPLGPLNRFEKKVTPMLEINSMLIKSRTSDIFEVRYYTYNGRLSDRRQIPNICIMQRRAKNMLILAGTRHFAILHGTGGGGGCDLSRLAPE